MGIRDVVLTIILIIAVPASLFRPFTGVLFWSWISYFNPHEFTFGFARHLPVGWLIALPTLIGLVLTNKRQKPPVTKETILLIALLTWFGITSLDVAMSVSLVHHLPDTMAKLWMVAKMLLMVFVALALVTDAKRLRWWYLVTAASFALFAFKSSVFGVLTGGEFKIYGPANSMIADNNDFGLAMNMVLPMFLCLARTEKNRYVRWAFWLSIPLGIVSVVLTYSRGALLGLVVVMLAMAWNSKHRGLALTGILLAAMAVFMFAPGQWIQRMQTIRTAAKTDPSALSRLRSWTFAYRLWRDHPIFGGGFDTFTLPLYSKYGMALADDELGQVRGPHSIYFQMLAEHGIVGLMLFLSMIMCCVWSCRKIKRRFRHDTQSWLAQYANMIQLSFVPYVISGAFLGRAYFDLFYQLVATVILLQVFARREMQKRQRENFIALQPLRKEAVEMALHPMARQI